MDSDFKLYIAELSEEEFEAKFQNDDDCHAHLADLKWGEKKFVCRKCGHSNYCKGRRPLSRRCTKCKSEESATAHTPFHRCKIPLKEAFRIAWLCCTQPQMSSWAIARDMGLRQMTCWKLKTKLFGCKQGDE